MQHIPEEISCIRLGDDEYRIRLMLAEDFNTLDRWRRADSNGLWTVRDHGLVGEWFEASPSIFLKDKIEGDYLWQITATRIQPEPPFLKRHEASTHGQGKDPAQRYNFNFWLRADTPDGEEFFGAYTRKLGTGWNGMGDDHWTSLFVTIVRASEGSRVRLRRSPGYQMALESFGVVPFLAYGQMHTYTFVLREGRVRMYLDHTRVFDYEDPDLYASGYIGLCVWLTVVRFEKMRVYRYV